VVKSGTKTHLATQFLTHILVIPHLVLHPQLQFLSVLKIIIHKRSAIMCNAKFFTHNVW